MMDEVWLRARRSLVHRLEEEGFWQSLAKYETCRKEQNDLGNGIKIGIFKDILGKEDYALLNSESIFGVGNTRFRRKFPYMAAFGYKIGLIAQILNNAEIVYAKDVSEVSSIFNVGISIFDYICDEDPKKFDYLKMLINEERLLDISRDESRMNEFQLVCDATTSSELRLILKIIAGFYKKLQSFYRPDRADSWNKVVLSLLSAYNFEIKSATSGGYSEEEVIEISKRKSIMPFIIIDYISQLTTAPSSENQMKNNTTCIENLGEIFWLTDDLVDVNQDLESGYLNSLLLQINNRNSSSNISDLKYKTLSLLLEGDYIEKHTDQICSSISNVFDYLDRGKYEYNQVEFIKNFITFSIRNWIS